MPSKSIALLTIPFLPLRGTLVFPHMVLHIDVGRGKSVAAINQAMMGDQRIFLVMQKDIENEEPALNDLYRAGTIARVKQVLHLPGNNMRVLIEGEERAILKAVHEDKETWVATVRTMPPFDKSQDNPELQALIRLAKESLDGFAEAGNRLSEDLIKSFKRIEDPQELVDVIAANLIPQVEERYALLSLEKPADRLEQLCVYLAREVRNANVDRIVQQRIRMQVDKSQREYYLREQLKAIQEELGEGDFDDVEEMREQLKKIPLNEEAREKADKELEKLSRMMAGSPESTVSENYLDWLAELPWGKYTKDQLSLKRARRILEQDHYGMDPVKERIIEYLAVMSMRREADATVVPKGPILCFVGPPGVGKTSIVQAIAKAMGRKFVKMSLGGVRDEAEIYGHRRTYIGAIPGHIISGIKRAGTMNPVFLFDEIDKMGNDYRGDPASAMLEVLDPAQNAAFRDHYLDVPFDLSRVLFITTANTRESIPPPLLDRMEVIEVASYTEEEKLQIAKRHLLRQQVAENGLAKNSVTMTQAAIRKAIEGYTREAGVRSLSRTLAKAVRKAAVEMLETGEKKLPITADNLEKYLGSPRFLRDKPEQQPLLGVVNGLAYTEVGGEMLKVECAVMPGSGKLALTGHLGDVMKESGQAALSWVRAHAADYAIDADFHKDRDIHIHVPEGAVPKDGPSAGVTMTVALVSALSGRKASQDIAMTGEITLGGRVLPIGGIKEKLLAAYRGKMKRLALPRENHKDVAELPGYIQEAFEIYYVGAVGEVIAMTLEDKG
ncbi:MAG: endopeptidase La [Eubacteriales bacterium]|jgi:ATP-dependent Lon protease|nr:endopeptidase La [Eubacteriales bacterium]MDD4135119.1 endopeptidase La [Eubacteriales bacterium]NLO13210.1 endopeptidase La [Clostridiales bacterium]